MTVTIKRTLKEQMQEAANTVTGNVHIIPSAGKWAVKKEGAFRASRVETDKENAIAWAGKLVSNDGKVVIHTKEGKIQIIH